MLACVRTYVHASVRACVRACIRPCVRACIHTCIHTCMNAYTRTRTHAILVQFKVRVNTAVFCHKGVSDIFFEKSIFRLKALFSMINHMVPTRFDEFPKKVLV